MRRLWSALAVAVLLGFAGTGAAIVAPKATELTIEGPSVVLAGTTKVFEGEHRARYGGFLLPATRVELLVDGVGVGTDSTTSGVWAIPYRFASRGEFDVFAVAEEGLPQESMSPMLRVLVADAPTPPLGAQAVGVPGMLRVEVSWQAPADDGGAPITSYLVERRTDGGAWMTLATLSSDARSLPDEALQLGRSYEYAVRATNAVASSPRAEMEVTGVVPSVPALVATPHDGSNGVELMAGATGGLTQRLEIRRSLDEGLTWTLVAAANGGLLVSWDGVDFSKPRPLYAAVARSVVGDSPPGAASVIGDAPSMPEDVSLEFADVLRVRWSEPTGGGPVQAYRVLDRGAQAALVPATARSAVVPIVPGAAQSFSVQALNLVADGAASAAVEALAPPAPSLAGGPRADTNLVDLLAVSGAGAGPTQSLVIERSIDEGATWQSVASGAGSTLEGTDAVSFAQPLPAYRAIARNLVGASSAVAGVIVADEPGAPTHARAEVSSVLTIMWEAPTTGGPVQQYEVLDEGARIALLPATQTRLDVADVLAGESHAWSVRALNVAGASAESDAVTVEPPAAPTLDLAIVSGTTLVRLDAGATDALARELEYERSADGGASWSRFAVRDIDSEPVDVAIDFGAQMPLFRALARGPTGVSAAMAATILGSPPSAPTELRFQTGDDVRVLWDAASGAQQYLVRDHDTLLARVGPGVTSLALDPWAGAPVSITVEALNYVGASGQSSALTGTFDVPSAPLSLSASTRERFNGALTDLTWSAPASNGGATINSYEVYRTPGPTGGTQRIATLSATATSFTGDAIAGDGTSYRYDVRATNAMGKGVFASVSVDPDLGWEIDTTVINFQVCETIYPPVGGHYHKCTDVPPGGTYTRTEDAPSYADVHMNITGTVKRHGAPVANTEVTVLQQLPDDPEGHTVTERSETTASNGSFATYEMGHYAARPSGCQYFGLYVWAETASWQGAREYEQIIICE